MEGEYADSSRLVSGCCSGEDMFKRVFLVGIFCFVSLGVLVSVSSIFVRKGSPSSLFGIRLGQTMPHEGSESFMHCRLYTNLCHRYSCNIKIPSQWECYMFSPESEIIDSSFRDHRFFIDRTNRQVVAVLANFASRSPGSRSFDSQPSELFTNLLERAFSQYGQCETRLSGDLWNSGSIYRTTFFIPSGERIVISHHQQFGGELCLYNESAFSYEMVGWVLPERCSRSVFQGEGFDLKKMEQHPALQLYEMYRNRRRSTIGVWGKRFTISVVRILDFFKK